MALFHKIVVPTDFSDGARRALEYGAGLAATYTVPLVLLHVYASPAVPVPDGFILATPAELAKMLAQVETGLVELRRVAHDLGVGNVETAVVEGRAWHEIVHFAKDRGCDLIVMGTHGRGGLSHFLLGSTAEKVVRKAEVPVLTVGPKAPRAETSQH